MEISRHWRLQKQRYGLVGEQCHHCGENIFPPRDVCPECAQEAQEIFRVSGKGEVFSYSTVFDAPAGYEGIAPYTVALVKLKEGPLVNTESGEAMKFEILLISPAFDPDVYQNAHPI